MGSNSLNILAWYSKRTLCSSECGPKLGEEVGDDFFECHFLTKQSFFSDLILSSAFSIPKIVKVLVTILWLLVNIWERASCSSKCGTKPGEEIAEDFVKCHSLTDCERQRC